MTILLTIAPKWHFVNITHPITWNKKVHNWCISSWPYYLLDFIILLKLWDFDYFCIFTMILCKFNYILWQKTAYFKDNEQSMVETHHCNVWYESLRCLTFIRWNILQLSAYMYICLFILCSHVFVQCIYFLFFVILSFLNYKCVCLYLIYYMLYLPMCV